MAINSFKRITDYFDSFTTLKAASLDSQFNMIDDYINSEVLPVLNTINTNAVPGSNNPADVGKYLKNTGDFTTSWSTITSDAFKTAGLNMNSLEKAVAASVVGTNAAGILKTIAPTAGYQVLSARYNDLPLWTKLTGDNLTDRAVSADNILAGTVNNINLPPELLVTQLNYDSLTGAKFKDASISSIKLVNNNDEFKLTVDKLTPELAEQFATTVWSNIIPDNFLQGGSVDWNSILTSDFARILNPAGSNSQDLSSLVFPASKYAPATLSFMESTIGIGIHPYDFAPNSVDPERLHYYILAQNIWSPSNEELLGDECIHPEHLTPELRIKLGF